MPRNEKETIVVIEGEEIILSPIKGAKNSAVVFELMSLASRIMYAASQANINLGALITEDGFDFSQIRGENLLVFNYVANELLKEWEHLLVKVFPVLLGKDPQWLADHGTPFEYFNALWAALTLNAPNIFGEKMWASLKNLLSAPPEEEIPPEEAQDETS